MYKPPHPGTMLHDTVLSTLGLSETQIATQLGVSREALSRVLDGDGAITADMAIHLSRWLGGNPESWLWPQVLHDFWLASKQRKN